MFDVDINTIWRQILKNNTYINSSCIQKELLTDHFEYIHKIWNLFGNAESSQFYCHDICEDKKKPFESLNS